MTQPLSQKARAAAVLEHMLGSPPALGTWVERKRGSESIAVWVIEADEGWSASFDFTSDAIASETQTANPLENPIRSFLLDVWFVAEGVKVLSLNWTGPSQTIRFVSMRPSPWEEMFELPHRDWSPSDLRKLTLWQISAPISICEIAAQAHLYRFDV